MEMSRAPRQQECGQASANVRGAGKKQSLRVGELESGYNAVLGNKERDVSHNIRKSSLYSTQT